ncbi:MAG TPA: indole-3-glycerol phosphate synthase TrpC [Acidimicrobiales bacterium]|jgi:indole-3-glycerol phosphate synthase|nr:indole-3-glycerol phosphate synthase TrpC [Acidimicrobiales bacterium]
MATYLDRILAAHRAAAGADRRDPADLVRAARALPAARGFGAALAHPGLAVIAEVKRRSPSAGVLRPAGDSAAGNRAKLDPGEIDAGALAREYLAGGAACLSVLTDAEFFGGSPADLAAASGASGLPVLRKDFTVGPLDVCDARLMGADAVLLIVGALSPTELTECAAVAADVGLDTLFEVHDEEEVAAALDAGATLVGVNQRDLVTFEVDTARAERVAKVIPDDVIRVAESGIRGRDDAARLADAGFAAVLVGSALVTSADPAAAVAAMRGL